MDVNNLGVQHQVVELNKVDYHINNLNWHMLKWKKISSNALKKLGKCVVVRKGKKIRTYIGSTVRAIRLLVVVAQLDLELQ